MLLMVVNCSKQLKKLLNSDENFIKNYDENTNKGYNLEVDVKFQKRLINVHKVFPFLAERKKIENCKKLICSIHRKENYSSKIGVKSWINTKETTQSNSI